MIDPCRARTRRLPLLPLLLFALFSALIAAAPGCREKSGPTQPPDNPPTGEWQLFLIHDGVAHYGMNDTITVRVYDPNGVLKGGMNVRSTSRASVLSVSPSVTTITDTLTKPWGTSIPLAYWGADTTLEVDTITSQVVRNDSILAQKVTIVVLNEDF